MCAFEHHKIFSDRPTFMTIEKNTRTHKTIPLTVFTTMASSSKSKWELIIKKINHDWHMQICIEQKLWLNRL